MRILFYAGYQSIPFDGNTELGLGGTEIAIIKLSREMVKFGYNVVVSGQIKNSGLINGVEWISTDELHQKYLIKFDYIISASYIHFLKEFKDYSAKKIFWAHNTHHHAWFNGIELKDADELTRQVDHTICLTNWHKNQWSNKYGVPLDKISIIGNGIDPLSFYGNPQKIKGRFIFSSAHERGLPELLNNWHKIKNVLPHATLDVFSPIYSPLILEYELDKYDGVTSRGSASQEVLHNAMLKAEYWCYVTDYEETYCITALEMQYAKVLPIVTKVAALTETVNSGILLERSETNWDDVIQILGTLGEELKTKSIEAAFQWAKKQTWEVRSYELKKLLNSV